MKKTKEWLIGNKIFIEILSLILLVIILIMVIWTNIIISKRQAHIEEQKMIPRIEVDYKYEYDFSLKYTKNELLKIFNHGGDILDLEINIYCYLELYPNKSSGVLVIPFEGYFNKGIIIKNSTFDLIYKNESNYTQKDLTLKYLNSSILNSRLSPDFIFILRINYRDIINRNLEEYYTFSSAVDKRENGNFRLIDNTELINNLMEQYNNNMDMVQSINGIPQFEELTDEYIKHLISRFSK
jgi:hypothetical protein